MTARSERGDQRPLAGAGILVTRPREQSAGLVESLQRLGGRVELLPAVEIEPLAVSLTELSQDFGGRPGLLLFVSANAVRHGLGQLPARLLESWKTGAVGEATARALRGAGCRVDLLPAGRQDSEGLLQLPQLQDIKGQRVLIVRGEGGRELLAESLVQRGARVDYLEVYRRTCPQVDTQQLVEKWDQRVQLALVTSSALLDNLCRMLGTDGTVKLKQTPLVVVSERTLAEARQRGFQRLRCAAGAGDQALSEALVAWWRELRQG